MFSDGYGLAPHVRSPRDSLFAKVSEEAHVRQSIFFILTVREGERPLQPEFGNRLHDFLYRPNTARLRQDIDRHIRDILAKHEPRARDVEVEVIPSAKDPTTLEIAVRFRAGSQAGTSVVKLNLNLQGGFDSHV